MSDIGNIGITLVYVHKDFPLTGDISQDIYDFVADAVDSPIGYRLTMLYETEGSGDVYAFITRHANDQSFIMTCCVGVDDKEARVVRRQYEKTISLFAMEGEPYYLGVEENNVSVVSYIIEMVKCDNHAKELLKVIGNSYRSAVRGMMKNRKITASN